MADVFLVQDEIVNRIVAKIAGPFGAIERNETKVSARRVLNRSRPMTSCCARAKSCSGIGPPTTSEQQGKH